MFAGSPNHAASLVTPTPGAYTRVDGKSGDSDPDPITIRYAIGTSATRDRPGHRRHRDFVVVCPPVPGLAGVSGDLVLRHLQPPCTRTAHRRGVGGAILRTGS